MKYDKFVRTMTIYREAMDKLSELHYIGFDFYEGKYELNNYISNLFENTFADVYTDEGKEWIGWFIFEADWGERDFSLTKSFDDTDEEREWGAYDSEGNKIAYDLKSLWELLEKDYKVDDE